MNGITREKEMESATAITIMEKFPKNLSIRTIPLWAYGNNILMTAN